MRLVHVAVDALGKIGQRRAEGKELLRLPAVTVEEVYPRQRAEFQLVEVRRKAVAHRLVPRGVLVHVLQQVGHPLVGGRLAGVKIALDDVLRNRERRLRLGHGGGELVVARHVMGVLVNDRVVLVFNGDGAQDVAALAGHVDLGNGGAHPDRDRVRRDNPLLDRVRKDHVEVGALLRQLLQRGAVPLAGMAAVDKLHLRVCAQIFIEPTQRFLHRNAVGFGKARKIGARHFGKLGDLVVVHAGIAEAGNVQVQLLGRVKAELPAERFFVLKVAVKLRAQKVHHDRAGHGRVFGVHAVGLQAGGGALAPAGLHAALGVAVHVEPVALLLRVGEHLLPVQVDDFVAAANIVVHMAVDGLVVIHAAGDEHLGLVFAEQPQMLGVQQLADLRRVAAPLELELQQKVALILADGVLIQNQKV